MTRGTVAGASRMPPPFRIHQSFVGSGTVHDGARALGAVTYSLRDVEELHRYDVPAAPGGAAVPNAFVGERNVYGTLATPVPDLLAGYVGARLALTLEDGRSLDFTVAKVMAPQLVLVNALGALR